MKKFYLIAFLLFFISHLNAQTCTLNCNGGFDNTFITTGVGLVTSIPCWSTNAGNSTMEVWGNGANGVSSYSGIQFVELNATMAATMFQTVTAVSGTPFSISFAHRGRAGIDTMEVSIGPVGGPYTSLGKFGDGTSAWGTYTVSHIPTTSGLYEIRFTPIYWSGGNPAIGNFLDGVSVSTPVNLVIGATSTTICSGGSVTLTASGALSYTWIPISVNPTIVVSPTITTTYYLYGHANACTDADSITIVVSSAAPVVISGPTSVCAGSSATLTGSGATTYTWNTSANSSSIVVTPTSTTVYSLVGGASSCSGSATFTTTVVNYPVLSVSNVSICPGQVATLTANGAITYTWNNPFATGATYTHNPLATEQYTVIGSISGCTSMATASVILKSLPVPVISSNSPLCANVNLVLNGSGGNSYLWSGPSGFNSTLQNPVINQIGIGQAGVYNVAVTGINNCTASANTTVVVYPPPIITVIGGDVCVGQNLSITANSSAGVNYLWQGPLNFTSTSQNIYFPNASLQQAGVYTVVVTNTLGCTNTATSLASVNTPPNLQVSLSPSVICAQAYNGSINTLTVNLNGALTYTLITPNYINNSNPFAPTTELSMDAPYQPVGVVNSIAYGSNGACSVSTSVVFTVIPNPVVLMSAPAQICADQSFTFTSTGAISYTWSSSPSDAISTISGSMVIVKPTVTSVFSVVGSSLGCSSNTQTNTLIVQPLPEFKISPDPARVCLGSTTVLSANGNGTSYQWTPSTAISSNFGSTVNINPSVLQNYNYTVMATLNTCTSTAFLTVSVMPLPTPSITKNNKIGCVNDFITLQGSGGSYYSWQGPTGFVGDKSTLNIKINSMAYAGIYTLTVTDQNSCMAKATQSITLYDIPRGYFKPEQLKGCAPFCANLSFQLTPLTTSLNLMNWQIGNQNYTENNFKHCFKEAGEHTINGTLRDTNNCINQFAVTVTVYPKPQADFVFSPETPVENLDPIFFTNTSKGESLESYNWYFTNNKGYQTTNKNTSYLYQDGGNYPVAMKVVNAWGCSDTIVKIIPVDIDFNIYVPNIFTPNDDLHNEVFLPIVRGVTFYNLMIFDRWGEKLFETDKITKGWDGIYKGEPCKNDIYVWKINLSARGEQKEFKGHVTLSR